MNTEGEWTATPPTVPGWYWWRCGKLPPRVLRVYDDDGHRVAAGLNCEFGLARTWGGEWWTVPIQEPPA